MEEGDRLTEEEVVARLVASVPLEFDKKAVEAWNGFEGPEDENERIRLGRIILFEAIAIDGYSRPSEFIKLKGLTKRYLMHLPRLIELGLVKEREWKGSNAKRYELTELGVYCCRKEFLEEPFQPDLDLSESPMHANTVKEFSGIWPEWQDGERRVSIPWSKEYGGLGIKPGVCELDCVKSSGSCAVLYEFETGSNNKGQLMTSLCKLLTRRRLEKANNVYVWAVWECASIRVLPRLLDCCREYAINTGEPVKVSIGTTENRRSNRMMGINIREGQFK